MGQAVNVDAPRTAISLVIANGASVSPSADLGANCPIGIMMPSAWTTAALTIEVSDDNSDWRGLAYDDVGVQCNVVATPVASSAYALSALGLMPYRYARLRSGTTATPVNQGADRTVKLLVRPLA